VGEGFQEHGEYTCKIVAYRLLVYGICKRHPKAAFSFRRGLSPPDQGSAPRPHWRLGLQIGSRIHATALAIIPPAFLFSRSVPESRPDLGMLELRLL